MTRYAPFWQMASGGRTDDCESVTWSTYLSVCAENAVIPCIVARPSTDMSHQRLENIHHKEEYLTRELRSRMNKLVDAVVDKLVRSSHRLANMTFTTKSRCRRGGTGPLQNRH